MTPAELLQKCRQMLVVYNVAVPSDDSRTTRQILSLVERIDAFLAAPEDGETPETDALAREFFNTWNAKVFSSEEDRIFQAQKIDRAIELARSLERRLKAKEPR